MLGELWWIHTAKGRENNGGPLIPPILETIGGPISWGQLTCLITSTVEEALWWGRALLVNEEESEALVEDAPVAEHMVQSARGVASTSLANRRLASPALSLLRQVAMRLILF